MFKGCALFLKRAVLGRMSMNEKAENSKMLFSLFNTEIGFKEGIVNVLI